MITLSEDGKTLTHIESWEDIISRPGYKPKVHPKQTKPKYIIALYNISPEIHCGLSTCNTGHNKGYLVVFEGGIETNMGNRCGRREFGIEFGQLVKTYKLETNAQDHRINLEALKNRTEYYTDRIRSIADGEYQGHWCVKVMQKATTTLYDDATLKNLADRARRKDPIIKRVTTLTGRDLELAKESGMGSVHSSEDIDTIKGLSAFTEYRKLKAIIELYLGSSFERFKELDIDSLTHNELSKWNRWGKEIEPRLNDAERIIRESKLFLAPSNRDTIINNKAFL